MLQLYLEAPAMKPEPECVNKCRHLREQGSANTVFLFVLGGGMLSNQKKKYSLKVNLK